MDKFPLSVDFPPFVHRLAANNASIRGLYFKFGVFEGSTWNREKNRRGGKKERVFFLISFDFFAFESALNMAAFWRRLDP